MTPEVDLAGIRKRLEEATRGPWKAMCNSITYYPRKIWIIADNHIPGVLHSNAGYTDNPETSRPSPIVESNLEDAEFIAHSWQDITDLLALAEGIDARVKEAEERMRQKCIAEVGDMARDAAALGFADVAQTHLAAMIVIAALPTGESK